MRPQVEKPDFVKIAEALTEARVMGSAILQLENVTIQLTVKDHRHPLDTPASTPEDSPPL